MQGPKSVCKTIETIQSHLLLLIFGELGAHLLYLKVLLLRLGKQQTLFVCMNTRDWAAKQATMGSNHGFQVCVGRYASGMACVKSGKRTKLI